MIFESTPPDTEMQRPLPLLRTKPRKPIQVVHVARTWVGVNTHWFGGHTVACDGDECTACDRNIPRIWKGFVPVQIPQMQYALALLQFTPLVVPILREHCRPNDDIYGMKGMYFRVGAKINSPLGFTMQGWNKPSHLFTPARVENIVTRIFQKGETLFDGLTSSSVHPRL